MPIKNVATRSAINIENYSVHMFSKSVTFRRFKIHLIARPSIANSAIRLAHDRANINGSPVRIRLPLSIAGIEANRTIMTKATMTPTHEHP